MKANESRSQRPVIKDLVLVGGGHSHVAVIKGFGMKPIPGVRMTVISREIHTPYSGMLPGLVAGHYEFDDAHIDLSPLCRFAGSRLFHDEVVGLDLDKKRVLCKNRPPVAYDVLSIDIGSTPLMSNVPGAAENVTPVKPISNFTDRWKKVKERVLQAEGSTRIGIVGAGAGGIELTLAAQYALGRMLEKQKAEARPEFHLFSGTEILPTHNNRARAKFRRILAERGVGVYADTSVVEVRSGSLRSDDGSEFALDEILWVTQAGAASWPGDSGLEVDERGFIRVADTLESTSHPGVFASGDIAAVVNHPREKAGVFAVRQGKPLEGNLRNALLGQPLEPFVPQRKFLSLISTGDQYAIASRGNWSLEGRYLWNLKDWIDRRFMAKYQVLPQPSQEDSSQTFDGLNKADVLGELSTVAMRCGGCGSKVGSDVLSRVLGRLDSKKREDILIGLGEPDDAAVTEVPAGVVLVQTVDFFRTIVDDPYLFGKIAATHCLGDIYAMGAEPQSALAVAVVPVGIEEKVEETLDQLLRGATEILDDASAALVGGHTSEGVELSFGLTINGLADRNHLLKKGGMKPGDRLLLTKPIGTGTLFAAEMRSKAKGRWVSSAIASMLQSNRLAAECFRRYHATACTDVTGFGLLGHLVEMTKASTVDARLFLRAVPLLDGALETVREGIFSSLHPQNLRLRRAIRDLDGVAKDPVYPLIFDPQTAGGLLASVPENQAEECLAKLKDLGYAYAAVVGLVLPMSGRPEAIKIEL